MNKRFLTCAGKYVGAVIMLFSLHSCTELAPTSSSVPSNPLDNVSSEPSIPVVKVRDVNAGGKGTLAPGDVIKIAYPGAPELDLSQKIRLDGKVSLPMIGETLASGKSVTQLQSTLASRYRPHLQNPNVVVTMESTASSVYVSGKVKTPMKIILDRPMTALEAIMEAGGFNDFGSPRRVSVVRNENGKHRRYTLNLNEALTGEAKAFYLKPFDVIYAR